MALIKIHNRFISDVSWASAAACDFCADNCADVWRISIPSNLSLINHFLAIINPDELRRANRYLHQHDRNRFIISRGALRTILGKYLTLQPSLIEFEKGPDKKPYIKNTPLFYNVSHSGDWIVIAVSKSEIGIDTEWVNPSFDFKDIINEYFSPGEISFIDQKQSNERFFMLWTRKEALTKATGKGLDDDLKFIPGLDGEHLIQMDLMKSSYNWIVSSFRLAENYFVSTANADETRIIRFWDIEF